MKTREHIYIVAGQGVMMLQQIYPNGNVRFAGHGWCNYWASQDQVVRKATADDLRTRRAQAKLRGLDCNDAGCWCVEVSE